MPTAGIKPGLPGQKASALSITPLPLGNVVHSKKNFKLDLTSELLKTMLGCKNGQLSKNESRIIAFLESDVVLV